MNNSVPLLQKGAKARPLLPKKLHFSEVIPLAGRNEVVVRRQRVAGSSCTAELQTLFGCLKQWEFDDLPCAKFHASYVRCVEESEKKAAANREAVKKGALGDDTSQRQSLSAAQMNSLMKVFPQPGLGKRPFRLMQRLPTYSYSDDLFSRKNKPGKKS